MTTRQALCALDLTPADLSAWRSHALSAEEYHRIGQHIPTCRACQQTLADYTAVADAMRDQAVPPSGAPLWRATQMTIQKYQRTHMNQRQKYVIAGGLGLLAVLILSFAIVLASSLPASSSTTTPTAIHPTATGKTHSTPVPTQTPPILQVSPSQGWVTVAALPFAKAIAFSADNPLDGYACGNLAQTTEQLPLELSATHDGGRTWQTPLILPIKGANCFLNVSPTDANDLLVGAPGCIAACDGDALTAYLDQWYRSRDGGATWNPLTLPTGDEQALKGYLVIPAFTWLGSSLVLQVEAFSQVGFNDNLPHTWAISQNGGPFTWLDTSAFYASLGITPDHYFGSAFTWQNNLLIPYSPYNKAYQGAAPVQFLYAETSDNGQTWTHFTPHLTDVAKPTTNINVIQDGGNVLYGFYFTDPPATSLVMGSSDGGHTWSPLPIQLSNTGNQNLVFDGITPDGTLFIDAIIASGSPVEPQTIESYTPGANTWQPVAQLSQTGIDFRNFATLSWDPSGHPLALWALIDHSKTTTQPFPDTYGVAYHAATP